MQEEIGVLPCAEPRADHCLDVGECGAGRGCVLPRAVPLCTGRYCSIEGRVLMGTRLSFSQSWGLQLQNWFSLGAPKGQIIVVKLQDQGQPPSYVQTRQPDLPLGFRICAGAGHHYKAQ